MKGSVLIVGNFLSTVSGVYSVCEGLSARLAESGWVVQSTSRQPRRLARLCDMLSTAWRTRRTYAVAQIDVYSGLAFLWAEAVCTILQMAGKPYVLTLHGGNLPAFARRWPRRVRRLLAAAAAVTTPSTYLQDQMHSYRDDIGLIANPLDLGLYEYRLRSCVQPRLVWLRSFHTIYNPTLAAHVLANLVPDFPDSTLTMIGPDKGDGSLQLVGQVAMQLGVSERLALPGGVPKSEVHTWLSRGDIFINTTNIDNTPVSVLEAMASGLCVVSTNVGGIPYLLQDGHDALLVPPDDPQAMADAVRHILTEPALAERLSRNARAKAQQSDWSAVLPQWESLLTAIAEGHRQ